jgi:hypothetical protein
LEVLRDGESLPGARGLIGAANRLYSVPMDASQPVELLILRGAGVSSVNFTKPRR